MEIKIQGSAKEIADLVVALQGQPQDSKSLEEIITLDGTSICRAVQEINCDNKIQKFSTKELVEELKQREGVKTTIAEPYADFNVKGNGPAIVLTVID